MGIHVRIHVYANNRNSLTMRYTARLGRGLTGTTAQLPSGKKHTLDGTWLTSQSHEWNVHENRDDTHVFIPTRVVLGPVRRYLVGACQENEPKSKVSGITVE